MFARHGMSLYGLFWILVKFPFGLSRVMAQAPSESQLATVRSNFWESNIQCLSAASVARLLDPAGRVGSLKSIHRETHYPIRRQHLV